MLHKHVTKFVIILWSFVNFFVPMLCVRVSGYFVMAIKVNPNVQMHTQVINYRRNISMGSFFTVLSLNVSKNEIEKKGDKNKRRTSSRTIKLTR